MDYWSLTAIFILVSAMAAAMISRLVLLMRLANREEADSATTTEPKKVA